MAVNDDIFDALVRHQIGLSRLASSNVDAITARLNKYDSKLRAVLQTLSPGMSKTALNKALRSVRQVNIQAYLAVEKDLTKAMKELAVAEVDYQHKTVTKALPKDARRQLDLKKPTQKDIKAQVLEQPVNGALLEEHINGAEIGRYNRVRDLVRREVVAGSDTAIIIAGVMGTPAANHKDGLLEVSRRSIDKTVRTVSTGIAQMARSEVVKQNDDIFDGETWVAMLESNTCAECQALDGTVFPVDEGPQPPVHINCRCERIPVVKDWEAMGLDDLGPGTRESMNGEVPETQNYNEWLRTQSPQVQDDILGPARGEMFREGGISLDRFVDDSGRRWTLAEMREQDAFADPEALYSKAEVGQFDFDSKVLWAEDSPFQTLASNMAVAVDNQTLLADAMNQATKAVGGQFSNPGVKQNVERIQQKLRGRSVASVQDLVRGGVTVDTPEQAEALVGILKSKFQIVDEGWQATNANYFDRKIAVHFPNGQIGELQLWQKDLIEAKNEIGHSLYERWRTLDAKTPEAEAVAKEMRDLYGGVLDRIDPEWLKLL